MGSRMHDQAGMGRHAPDEGQHFHVARKGWLACLSDRNEGQRRSHTVARPSESHLVFLFRPLIALTGVP